MGAQYNPAEATRLIAEARHVASQRADINLMRKSMHAMADQLEAARARVAELLQSMVKLTNELPYPDEVMGWIEQRAKLVAECGTLRARVAEVEATNWTLRQQLDGLQNNLTDARREASALRDRRGLPSDG